MSKNFNNIEKLEKVHRKSRNFHILNELSKFMYRECDLSDEVTKYLDNSKFKIILIWAQKEGQNYFYFFRPKLLMTLPQFMLE